MSADERPWWKRLDLVSWQSVVLAPCVGPAAWLVFYWVAGRRIGPSPSDDYIVLQFLLVMWMGLYLVTTLVLLALWLCLRFGRPYRHVLNPVLLALVIAVQLALLGVLFGGPWRFAWMGLYLLTTLVLLALWMCLRFGRSYPHELYLAVLALVTFVQLALLGVLFGGTWTFVEGSWPREPVTISALILAMVAGGVSVSWSWRSATRPARIAT